MSNDKVVHIAGGSPQDEPEVNEEAIKLLEDMLERYRSGEFYSLGMVALGETQSGVMVSGVGGHEPRMKGMLAFLSEEISGMIRGDLLPDPGKGA